MNQLQRIILVNSANIHYREVQLDGNIHFIGTQGTGKSTLLRAILFFYNADARKLGISKEKKSFAEYYFPYADSYIFYEVRQGLRHFCVWLYKRQNRLCFRFVDGAYQKEMVLSGNQALQETEVIEQVNNLGYKIHPPIYNFTEYRDIIFGANKSKRRFSLLQNPAYQNIPRTLSNIFLNSSLDGGFIKKTIINSLSDDTIEMNLDANRHHLETARDNYADVSEYLRQEIKAQKIVDLYEEITHQEIQKKELAWKIGAAHNQARTQQLQLAEQKTEAGQGKAVQEQRMEKLERQHEAANRLIRDKLSVVMRDIKTANRLSKEYGEKEIERLMQEQYRKPMYEQQRDQIQGQVKRLTSELDVHEQEYKAAIQNLQNTCQQQINTQRGELMIRKSQWQAQQVADQAHYYNEKASSTAEYHERDKVHQEALQKLAYQKQQVAFEMKNIHQASYYEAEQTALNETQVTWHQKLQEATTHKRLAQSRRDALMKEGEAQQKLAVLEGEQILLPLYQQKEQTEQQVQQLQEELSRLSGSLLEYLDKHHANWSDTIGKVMDKAVLLNSDLQPQAGTGNDCYGVQLNLDELAPATLSKSQLEQKLQQADETLKQLNIQIEGQLLTNSTQRNKLQQKFNKLIREQKELIKQNESLIYSAESALEKATITRHQLQEKEVARRKELLEEKEAEKYQLDNQIQEIQKDRAALEENHAKALMALEKDYSLKENTLQTEVKEAERQTEMTVRQQEQWLAKQKFQLEQEREQLLKDKGVDASEVQTLERELEQLDRLLKAIEKNYPTIIRYQKDCEEYIYQLSDFKRLRRQYEEDLEHKNQLYQRRIEQEQQKLKQLTEQLSQCIAALKAVDQELNVYQKFQQEALFEELASFIDHHDTASEGSCTELIDQLKNLALAYERNDKSLTERITAFAGYFNENNCLGFEIHVNGLVQCRRFAGNLTEFVREQKILDYQTEVTRKYAMVLNNIVNETNNLLQKEEDVNRVILKINGDFRKSNFVGVVRSIEMRIQESSNKVIQVLRKIRAFQAEKAMNFGEINLFNQGGGGRNDQQAVELLENLLRQIGQHKSKMLQLEDVFDLEFRIRENENDTNWVSRLSNVGSNGTDVLVKSMIYINLLHIFKSSGKKQAEEALLHCLIDEVGILHDSNVTGLITFAGERNIHLINGSPNSHNEQDYKHIYIFRKDKETNKTGITKLISNVL